MGQKPPNTVLFVSHDSNLYGSERSLLEILRHLDRRRFKPLVLLSEPGPLRDQLDVEGIPYAEIHFKVPLSVKTLFSYLKTVRTLRHFFEKGNVSLIHINFQKSVGTVGLAALFSRIPYMVHVRTMVSWWSPYERWLMSKASKIIVVSEVARGNLLQEKRRSDRFIRADARKIVVLPSGRSLERFQPKERLSERTDGHAVVGFVGAIDPRKRLELFLKAARIVSDRLPETRFLVVGDVYGSKQNAYKEQMKALCRDLGLERKISFLGFRHDVSEILHSLDVMVLPTKSEALGGGLIEAMAAGVPIVASSVGGIPELLGEDVARLIRSNLPEDYAEAVLHILSDRSLTQRMREAGRRRVAIFDMKPMMTRLESLYDQILSGATEDR